MYTPPVRASNVDFVSPGFAAAVKYSTARVPSPAPGTPRRELRQNVAEVATPGTPRQEQRREPIRSLTPDRFERALSVSTQSLQSSPVVVKRLISGPRPMLLQHERSSSPGLSPAPGVSVQSRATSSKVELRRPCEDVRLSSPRFSQGLSVQTRVPQYKEEDLPLSHHQQEVWVTQSTPVAALQMELKELKSILEKQYGRNEQGGSTEQTENSADGEHRVAKQVQLIQKVASVAPESKVRELCVNVACQQAEQEIFLRMLSTNVDVLQKHVQELRTNDSSSAKLQLPERQDYIDGWEKSSNADTSLSLDVESIRSQLETELKSSVAASIVHMCAGVMKETLGPELKLHSSSIKSLEVQMDCLKECCRQSMSTVQCTESIKQLKTQVSYLNEVTSQSLATLRSLIRQVFFGEPIEDQLRERGFHQQLHTIVENTCEAQDMEGNEVPPWFKTMYQDLVERPAASALSSNDAGNSDAAHVDSDVRAAAAEGADAKEVDAKEIEEAKIGEYPPFAWAN